ncbi:MAG: ATP-binding cassette domain-containing protein, partial [Propionivibrio sp.]|nr:ATP-binding cassette domain-containing protein [Propionivibrio sp.]
MEGISKRFGATRALDDVRLTVRSHEIHALMGENGAGKSTLMKVLSGVYQPDSGVIKVDGRPVLIGKPAEA